MGASLSLGHLRAAARNGIVYLLMVAASAGAGAGANTPQEYVDEQTGVTVTVVARPLVFVRDRTAFNGGPTQAWSSPPRDYVTLAAAAVDRTGKMTYLLIGYFWSVGVSQPWENARLAREPLVLQLQERRIELAPQGGTARDAGISEPVHPPPVGPATATLYAVDLPTLSLIAESAHPVLLCGSADAPVKYELFEDRLTALREFVRHLNDNN
jgi:hypothetical protein